MKIFKELNKLGYKHYTEHTIEELDNLPLNSEERIMEQVLVFKWFREKCGFDISVTNNGYIILDMKKSQSYIDEADSYEESEIECLKKLIEIIKNG